MAINSVLQTIRNAEIDARSLSEFISKDASFTVTRRLAPTIHTLDYYLLVLNTVKDKGVLADTAISATLDKLEQLEPTVIQRVEAAINNTAIEGGVLADTFVTVTANGEGQVARSQREKNSDVISIKDFGAIGDGVVDDTQVVQTAVDNIVEGTLHFPKGDYKIGSFTYPSSIEIYGENGAYFINDVGQKIAIPRGNSTNGPLEYFVSPEGSPENHGLSESCPADLISTVLKRMPRILHHDVLIYVKNGEYVENHMVGEWGRIDGLVIDGITVNPQRNSVDADYPTKVSYERLKKRAKLMIVGENMGNVIIKGRPDGVAYDNAVHARTGLVSRIRDLYIQGLTFEKFSSGITAHELGSISGYNITVRECLSTLVMAESQQAKIEIGGLTVDSTGSGYCLRAINGQININDSTIINGTNNGALCAAENAYIGFHSCVIKSAEGKSLLGVDSKSSTVILRNCTSVGLSHRFDSSAVTVAGGTYRDLTTSAPFNSQASSFRASGISAYNNGWVLVQYGGYGSIRNSNSMDGDTQKYNINGGVIVRSGFFELSPYTVSAYGFDIKGKNGLPETDVIYEGAYLPCDPVNQSKAEFSETGWTAGTLGSNINTLITKVKNPSKGVTTVSTLYAALKHISTISNYTVASCANKLNEITSALNTAGYLVNISRYYVDTASNTKEAHDNVRAKFNALISDLVSLGLIQAGGDIYQVDLIKDAAGVAYTIHIDEQGTLVSTAI